ncbi:hypothetical protein LTS08_001723 [Lithohypha guttulata]|nr:hypothetical protein LTS08_001723 [Lithohypha guttulata]
MDAHSQARLAQHEMDFRTLLADPQLEGDSSLPDPDDTLSARLRAHSLRLRGTALQDVKPVMLEVLQQFVLEDIPRAFWAVRKSLDLFGNDYYLAHIYRTLHWWTKPTHVTVLGDLIGSQWVSDDEFAWRGWRYWNRVLAGSHRVDEAVMEQHKQEPGKQQVIPLESENGNWSEAIINIVGNHDIGYAGDISPSRIERFERVFGKVNWDIHFSYPEHRLPQNYSSTGKSGPSLHMVILNSMILDTPALAESVQAETYSYINSLITSRLDPVEARNTTFTLLLTHVPLHKPEGVCVDAPLFEFWDHDDSVGAFKHGGLKEQNHLSEHTSHAGVLQGLFGMSGNPDAAAGGKGRNGLVLTGHDHEGCDVVHYIERYEENAASVTLSSSDADSQHTGDAQQHTDTDHNDDAQPTETWSWKSVRTSNYLQQKPDVLGSYKGKDTDIVASVREITLRSMMGEYSGNAGLLSLWYDFEGYGSWKYEIQMCPLGVQHIWWAVHITDIVVMISLVARILLWLIPSAKKPATTTSNATEKKITPNQVALLTIPKREDEHFRSSSPRRRKG